MERFILARSLHNYLLLMQNWLIKLAFWGPKTSKWKLKLFDSQLKVSMRNYRLVVLGLFSGLSALYTEDEAKLCGWICSSGPELIVGSQLYRNIVEKGRKTRVISWLCWTAKLWSLERALYISSIIMQLPDLCPLQFQK